MKILFVTGMYSQESLETLKEISGNKIQNAANVFQWAVVDGMIENNYDFEVVSFPFLPSYPINFSTLHTPSAPIVYQNRVIGQMKSYCALVGYKNISIRRRLRIYIKKWILDNKDKYTQLIILTYTPHHPFINAIKDVVKQYNSNQIIVASIVTDLVNDMLHFASNRGILKRIQCKIDTIRTQKGYKYIDKFILLTKAMEEHIPESKGNNIVVEGLVKSTSLASCIKKDENKIIFLYTGALDEFTGIGDLIDAFMLTKSSKYRLIICGEGALDSYAKDMSNIDNRIKYLGIVSRDDCVELQKQATCLVNPRKPNGAITKYSFPSKTMEYMISGTPMIGYKLEGMPKEYYKYMYIPINLSIESLAQTIDYVANIGQSELNEKAIKAYNFLMENKTSQKQVQRIIQFLETSKVHR